jgi:hypothetical protein
MEVMIKIKNTWLGEELFKDVISIDELLDLLQDKYDEVDYLEKELKEEREKQIDNQDYDEYHEKKVLGMLDE